MMKASLKLPECSLQFCNVSDNLRLCSGCRNAYYCGKDHQRRDWKCHRKQCIYRHSSKKASPERPSSPSSPTEIDIAEKAIEKQHFAHIISKCETDVTGTKMAEAPEPSQLRIPSPASFATKRSPDEADASYVDLKSLDLNRQDQASGSSEVVHHDTFSDQILRAHSYPLTPLLDDEDEAPGGEGSGTAGKGPAGWKVGKTETPLPSGPSPYPPDRIGIKKQPKEWHEKLTHYLVECMNKFGICVIDRVMGKERGEGILQEVLALQKEGLFTEGQLVKSSSSAPVKKGAIRGDKITWTDGINPPCKNIRYLISQMDTIIQMTNGHFENISISSRTKAMVACYPGNGTRYVKHVDNPTRDGRCITCIYYLNKKWNSKRDGGLLRIYPEGQDNVANVEPLFDRILFFWSDRRNPHEVFPAFRTRYAITVWYFNPTERAQAKRTCMGTGISTSEPSSGIGTSDPSSTVADTSLLAQGP